MPRCSLFHLLRVYKISSCDETDFYLLNGLQYQCEKNDMYIDLLYTYFPLKSVIALFIPLCFV